MSTAKKGLLTASGEWRKHLRWMKRGFWKGERNAVSRSLVAEDSDDEVARLTRSDGHRWVSFIHRPDGLFTFTEWGLMKDSDDAYLAGQTYSTPLRTSGLFASLEAARREARAAIAWLREAEDP